MGKEHLKQRSVVKFVLVYVMFFFCPVVTLEGEFDHVNNHLDSLGYELQIARLHMHYWVTHLHYWVKSPITHKRN